MDYSSLKNSGIDIRVNACLSEFTTFQLGGKCPVVLTGTTIPQVEAAVQFFIKRNLPFILLGGGSNLVVSDEGVGCAVIRFVCPQPSIEREGYELSVVAGTRLDDLVLFCAQQGLQGINFASGIPGTMGGAIVGNAGAFGKQIGDAVKSVTVITRTGAIREITQTELQFSYRDSRLKRCGDIVLKARLLMTPGNTVELLKERQEIIMQRWEKHPDFRTYPSAGSFFRNLEPTSQAGRRQAAGWFLDQVGAKQMTCGGAGVFEKHANIIVKLNDSCTAQDVYSLSCKMAAAVKTMHDLDLVREVRLVGKFDGVPFDPQQVIW